MPKRITVQGIIVQRPNADNVLKNFRPPIGKVFDYTAEEIEEIGAVNPAALAKVGEVEEVEAEGGTGNTRLRPTNVPAKPAAKTAAGKPSANASDL